MDGFEITDQVPLFEQEMGWEDSLDTEDKDTFVTNNPNISTLLNYIDLTRNILEFIVVMQRLFTRLFSYCQGWARKMLW